MSDSGKIHDLIEAEIDRRHSEYGKPRGPLGFSVFDTRRWYRKGSAGKALGWFDEIAEQHPDASADELALLLAEKCDQERKSKPRWYTKAHLEGVVTIVRGATTNRAEASR